MGQRIDDVLCHAIAEVFVLDLTVEVFEREDGDGCSGRHPSACRTSLEAVGEALDVRWARRRVAGERAVNRGIDARRDVFAKA